MKSSWLGVFAWLHSLRHTVAPILFFCNINLALGSLVRSQLSQIALHTFLRYRQLICLLYIGTPNLPVTGDR